MTSHLRTEKSLTFFYIAIFIVCSYLLGAKYPLLPTGVGEQYSQTISIICLAAPLCRCELPLQYKRNAELTHLAIFKGLVAAYATLFAFSFLYAIQQIHSYNHTSFIHKHSVRPVFHIFTAVCSVSGTEPPHCYKTFRRIPPPCPDDAGLILLGRGK
jgi:hypothetical protein